MKERPILFSAPMVRALLAGTKWQTRRVVKGLTDKMWIEETAAGGFAVCYDGDPCCGTGVWEVAEHSHPIACPYGQPGDRLWVRETWAPNEGSAGGYLYRADHAGASALERHDLKAGVCTHRVNKWRPSIHMPRAASRLLLEVTDVRVERLNDISADDAAAEGWPGPDANNSIVSAYPIAWYSNLWEQINGKGSWNTNPWVWAVSFRVIKGGQP